MKLNPLHAIDFYKSGHHEQYPEGTELVYSNLTPRSNHLSNLPEGSRNGVVFFGLQYFIVKYLHEDWNNNFFNLPKNKVVEKYRRRLKNALGVDPDLSHIEALHDLGYLPLEIRALPEGSFVPIKIPLFTIKNTLPEFYWLTNYVESILSNMLWKPCISATTARYYRKLCHEYAEQTCDSDEHVQFQCHDFSFRGMSGFEDACTSGAAHLTSFVGTDTVSAIDFVEEYYLGNSDEELIGASVPATEHSVMCMGGEDGEIETFQRLIEDVYPTGIVSIVSDTWDFWQVITEFLPRLKNEILNRDGKVVIRPDSGDPVDIICGTVPVFPNMKEARDALSWDWDTYNVERYAQSLEKEMGSGFNKLRFYDKEEEKYYECILLLSYDPYGYKHSELRNIEEIQRSDLTTEEKGAIECLWETFGGHVNDKGYKVLDEHIGLIYGDSITPWRAKQILMKLEAKGFASSNVVFGVGSFTYTYVTRDTYGLAVKATAGQIFGDYKAIYKDPKTDSGMKKSLRGYLAVVRTDNKDEKYAVIDNLNEEPSEAASKLKTVFKDGQFRLEKFDDIRVRVTEDLIY